MGLRYVAAMLLLVANGCAVAGGETSGSSASPEPSASSSLPSDPEAEAIAAYEGMWDVAVEASRDASPDHPDLERYATGEAAEVMRLGLEGISEALVGEPTHDIMVVSAEPAENPTTVELRDCQDASGWVPEGAPPSSEINTRVDATVTRDALAVWVVTDLRIWEPQTC